MRRTEVLLEGEDIGLGDLERRGLGVDPVHRIVAAKHVSRPQHLHTSPPEARAGKFAEGERGRSDLPVLLNAEEVGALLRTSRKAIYARVERGLLPGVVRDGRRVLFDREVVLSWLRQKYAPSPREVRR